MNGRRDHPRRDVSLAVTLLLADGTGIDAHTQNLSFAGFQLAAGREVVAALFPHTRQPGPRERREARISLRAPEADAPPVEVRCAGVFARRTSQTAWDVGFEFVDPPADARRLIETRLTSAPPRGEVS